MNFTEVVAEVLAICGRPEKLTRARMEVNAALNFYCGEADFARQLVEDTLAINSGSYAQSLPLTSFPRWKKFVWLRLTGSECFITPLDVAASLKKSNADWVNRYYVAGDNLIFKTSTLGASIEYGYQSYPPVLTDASPTHWLLEASPYLIINKACAQIFKNIGDDMSAKQHEAEARILFLSAKADFATGIARGR